MTFIGLGCTKNFHSISLKSTYQFIGTLWPGLNVYIYIQFNDNKIQKYLFGKKTQRIVQIIIVHSIS